MKFLLALVLLAPVTSTSEHARHLDKRFLQEHGIKIILDGDDSLNYFNRIDMELCRLERTFPVLDKFNFRLDIRDCESFIITRQGDKHPIHAKASYQPDGRLMILSNSLPLATGYVAIGGGGISNDTCSLFRHELGHHLWFEWMTEKQREKFDNIYRELRRQGISVSGVGDFDACELFSECFSAYTHPRYHEGLPVEVEEFIESVFKEHKEK